MCFVGVTSAVSVMGAGGLSSIKTQDIRERLSYIASDELQGRAVYTAGLGWQPRTSRSTSWGLKPAGDRAFLQTVKVLGVKSTSHASVTVDVDGETRTFAELPSNWAPRRQLDRRVGLAGRWGR